MKDSAQRVEPATPRPGDGPGEVLSKLIANGGLALGCLLVFSACGKSPEQTETVTKVDVSKTTSTTSTAPAPTKPLVSKLHMTYVLDDNIQYAIDSIDKAKNLGKTSKGQTAKEGELFYIVRFRAKNNGSESPTVLTDNFQIRSADGRVFSPSEDGKRIIQVNGGSKELFASELKPGTENAFIAIFEIPIESMRSGADLIVPSAKPGSNDRWVNRLNTH
ncbi:hypothetical protein BH10CYA1_BH10CYA1_34810 [soil metagenome]